MREMPTVRVPGIAVSQQSGVLPECREGRHADCDNPWCACDHHNFVQEWERYDLLCLRCRCEIHRRSGERKPIGCPECGDTQGIPADLNDTATITLTTHELRVLTIWAANYAESIKDQPRSADSPKIVYGILDAIMAQGVTTPLSMRQELADIRAEFGEATVYKSDGSESDL